MGQLDTRSCIAVDGFDADPVEPYWKGSEVFFSRGPRRFPNNRKWPAYDTSPLRKTLLEMADFARINSGDMRVSVGAVNVRNGNFEYFDNTR